MSEETSEANARRAYQEMVRDEIDMLNRHPTMLVKPDGEFGDYYEVRECDASQIEYVARRNVERAMERALRNKNATTEA